MTKDEQVQLAKQELERLERQLFVTELDIAKYRAVLKFEKQVAGIGDGLKAKETEAEMLRVCIEVVKERLKQMEGGSDGG
ncbi:MAG: hypothetical protein KatS3mg051_1817 [Anaerolineae bacterium]|nr:MAG: hypothetical protein KatS3mg051_1817 [Anaerolineae bacterium]